MSRMLYFRTIHCTVAATLVTSVHVVDAVVVVAAVVVVVVVVAAIINGIRVFVVTDTTVHR